MNRKLCAVMATLAVAFCLGFFGPAEAQAAQESTIAGANRFETAAKVAEAAYPSGCGTVIVAGSEAWPDALSATGLAGALDCPILFTYKDSLVSETASAIASLGAHEVVLLGSADAVSSETEDALRALDGVGTLRRVGGADRFETQAAVYEFGRTGYDGMDHWSHDLVMVASGTSFPDALSASPVAFGQKAPMLLVDSSGLLSGEQEALLLEGRFKKAAVLGSPAVVGDEALGYLEALTAFEAGDSSPHAERLGGADRYETSALFARWGVEQGYLSWDGAAFASGSVPYDALAGAVLQGKRGAALLLAGNAPSSTVDALARHAGGVSRYTYFGSEGAIPASMRSYVSFSLQLGHALPMGATRIADGSYVWCNWSGVYQQDNIYYRAYIDRANWYDSATPWLMLVDTVANRTFVMAWGAGTWVVEKDYLCSTGAWATPTVRGEFTIGLRGLAFGSGFTCWYWTQFYGDYLFHSVTYEPGSMTDIQEGMLGINCSHGCVRLDIANAKWIYDTIPSGTKVVVF